MRSIELLQKNIKLLLKKKGKSLKWLCDESNLTLTPVYNLFKDDANPRHTTLSAIADALNVEIAVLYLDHNKNKIISKKPYKSHKSQI